MTLTAEQKLVFIRGILDDAAIFNEETDIFPIEVYRFFECIESILGNENEINCKNIEFELYEQISLLNGKLDDIRKIFTHFCGTRLYEAKYEILLKNLDIFSNSLEKILYKC